MKKGYKDLLAEAEAFAMGQWREGLEAPTLPIELAAVRVAVHGVHATHALLGERFSLGWAGRRTALPRHQTLRAMLDWSYDLLSANERLVFERLAAFVGPFALEAASHIAAQPFFQWLNEPWANWLGLISRKPITEDYVPLLPWLGVVWWGLAAGQWALKHRPTWLGSTDAPAGGLKGGIVMLGK